MHGYKWPIISPRTRNRAIFFFSKDQRYIVKEVTKAERRTLLKMLPEYRLSFNNYRDSVCFRNILRKAGCYPTILKHREQLGLDIYVLMNDVRVRVQLIRHFKACTTDIYLQT